MRKVIMYFAAGMISFSSFSQNADSKNAIGFGVGLSDYHGELNREWFNVDNPFQGQFGLNYNRYLNKSFNLGLDWYVGALGFTAPDVAGIRTQMMHANLNLKFKLANGMLMPEDSKIQPYIFVGGGFARFFPNHPSPETFRYIGGNDLTFNSGLGLNYVLSPMLNVNYNLNWAYTSRDKRDGISNGMNDQFMVHTVGLIFALGKSKDSDGDGVGDRRDICPSTPSGVAVNITGCPLDKDGDKIPDYQDACPDVAGVAAMKGCPDKDGDGIVDAEDACPDVKGVASAKGCPDADGDGITDAEDKCPSVKGTLSMKGCPDTDGDGITDAEDKCPTVKGLATMMGCPDADGDGITDAEDKCPKVAGVASNNGCPEIKEETKKVFEQALKGIQFQTGKDIIKPTSFAILDNVVKIMKDNPTYKLDIIGHTDNQGDPAKNLDLSKRRAEAVKAYLVSKGVDAVRLTSQGKGDTMPKADNATAAGRTENRRVEFVVNF